MSKRDRVAEEGLVLNSATTEREEKNLPGNDRAGLATTMTDKEEKNLQQNRAEQEEKNLQTHEDSFMWRGQEYSWPAPTLSDSQKIGGNKINSYQHGNL